MTTEVMLCLAESNGVSLMMSFHSVNSLVFESMKQSKTLLPSLMMPFYSVRKNLEKPRF